MRKLFLVILLMTPLTLLADGEIYYAFGTDAVPLPTSDVTVEGRWIDWRGATAGSLYVRGENASSGTFIVECTESTDSEPIQCGPEVGATYTISDSAPLPLSLPMTGFIRINVTLSAGTVDARFQRDKTK